MRGHVVGAFVVMRISVGLCRHRFTRHGLAISSRREGRAIEARSGRTLFGSKTAGVMRMPTGDRDEFNLQEAFEYARSTIQTLIAINGGAAAAIIAFYGQALSAGKASGAAKGMLADALTAFTLGVVFATLTLILGYLTQRFWGANHPSDADTAIREGAANAFNVVAIACALLALAAFIAGCFSARNAFLL